MTRRKPGRSTRPQCVSTLSGCGGMAISLNGPAGIAGIPKTSESSKRGTTPLTAPKPDATAARHPDGTGGRPSKARSL